MEYLLLQEGCVSGIVMRRVYLMNDNDNTYREEVLKKALASQPHIEYLSRSRPDLVNCTRVQAECFYHGKISTNYRSIKNKGYICVNCVRSSRFNLIPIRLGDVFPSNSKDSGDFEVINVIKSNKILVKFIDTGTTTVVTSNYIRKGWVKDRYAPTLSSKGYIGEGKYKSAYNGKDTKSYTCWRGMLARCYNEHCLKLKPSYRGVEVCKEWHNYQNFAKWYYNNIPEEDGIAYQLDKDILSKEVRIYSPSTCTFVSNQVNSEVALSKDYTFIDPKGGRREVYNLNKFCKDNNLTHPCMHNVHTGKAKSHKGWTKYKGDADEE